MRPGFSPLDEELALLPGSLSPALQAGLARLGTWLPFAQAAAELGWWRRVPVSEPTARRLTEAAGAAYVATQTVAVAALERAAPEPPAGPAVLQVSVDGAMVPLLRGEWAEVKTLAVGGIAPPVLDRRTGEWEVPTHDWSYFSRLADHETFARLATVETHRRGVATAGRVCGVVDGADWCQQFLDYHRPDAVRVLDFPHAIEHVSTAGQAAFGGGTAAGVTWLGEQAHTLKHGDPDEVLAALRALPVVAAPDPAVATAAQAATLAYLAKRRAQIAYAEFRAAGYPIGSGSVESANKLVVEVRLKGAGMHWARAHVNPMVALRTAYCAGRWDEAWPAITAELRAAHRRRCQARRPVPAAAAAPPSPRPPARKRDGESCAGWTKRRCVEA